MALEPDKERLKRISLHPMSLEDALKKIVAYKVEPKPQKGGRKKKPPEIQPES